MTSKFPSEYIYSSEELSHTYSYMLPQLLSLLPPARKDCSNKKVSLLDLGCGNGSLCSFLFQEGYDVTGVEPSDSGIAIASDNFPDCQFIKGSIYELPTELYQAFDAVIAADVIEHLFAPRELAKAARKCLKPGGALIITTPYHGYFKNLALALSGKFDRHFTALWDGGHIKFFSVPTLTTLLQEEGYSELNYDFAGRFPYVWKTMLCSSKLPESAG